VIADVAMARIVAQDIGYPVMIKASAGGGGKGMRLAASEADLEEGFRSASNEARSSFGDDRILIEKAIVEPRHIEIQVMGDSHGNVIFLGERECSIQRRHQKVIEESPSPFISAETRAKMGAEAVALAKAVQYRSAGTVEFIVDKNQGFYFLEMNTRLQVEHPVTEEVTGLDLVELMIRVAYGEKLPLTQEQVKLTGSAIEARVYAEDPLRNFVPSIGRLTQYRPPEGEGVRVDTGVYAGSEISMFYDPMIAKLITYAPTRAEATRRMVTALDSFVIRGVNHNIGFLAAIMEKQRFKDGRLSTDFIGLEFPEGFQGANLSAEDFAIVVSVASVANFIAVSRDAEAGFHLHPLKLSREWTALVGAPPRQAIMVVVERAAGGEWVVTVDGKTHRLATACIEWRVYRAGGITPVRVVTRRTGELAALMPVKEAPDMSRYLLSPMPGLLVSLAVVEGAEVKAGEELAVIEAMKMMNVLRAERDGKVKKIHAAAKESLSVDQIIIEFE
jgi:propionyl-CoA carboxylase alpha chain